MYPRGELIRLERHKAALCRRIARRRVECVEAAGGVARPFAWLDRALALWRRVSPLALIAAVPLGLFLFKRAASPRLKMVGAFVKWAPLVLGVMRGMRVASKSRVSSSGA